MCILIVCSKPVYSLQNENMSFEKKNIEDLVYLMDSLVEKSNLFISFCEN
jgi:hypothetical protein